ncbi:MAG: SURF1 family protein [Pseudomonadota bacterium]
MAETPQPHTKQPAKRRTSPLVVISLVLPALVMLLLLGNWQVQRLAWKEDLLATIDTRMQQAPVDMDAAISIWQQQGDVDYLPVTLEGRFLHDREQYFLATYKGQSGWYVYTPLQMPDERTVIVNRGYVPYDLRDPTKRSWQPIEDSVTIVGLARNPLPEKPGSLLPDNTPDERTWYWKDHTAMAQTMGLSEATLQPFFVDVSTTNGAVSAGPAGGVTRVSLPNNHLQYAITWFGLAAALIVVTGVFLWRKQ